MIKVIILITLFLIYVKKYVKYKEEEIGTNNANYKCKVFVSLVQ